MFNLPLYDKNMLKSFTKDKIIHILIIAIVIGIFAFYKSMQEERRTAANRRLPEDEPTQYPDRFTEGFGQCRSLK